VSVRRLTDQRPPGGSLTPVHPEPVR
jgi:hypothetical protein